MEALAGRLRTETMRFRVQEWRHVSGNLCRSGDNRFCAGGVAKLFVSRMCGQNYVPLRQKRPGCGLCSRKRGKTRGV